MKNLNLKFLFNASSIFILMIMLLAMSCDIGGSDTGISNRIDRDLQEAPSNNKDLSVSLMAACPSCDNCVLYARCKVPSLPFGLFSYQDKKTKAINWWGAPAAGMVAIMPSNIAPAAGHVAYVQSVNSDGTITISEGNHTMGKCGSRRQTPAQLRIDGYWKP
jgi:hypothetical protein